MFVGRITDLKKHDINRTLREILAESEHSGIVGGIVIFQGHVKGVVDGKKVIKLVYEAYEPHATRIIDSIAKSYEGDPQISSVVIYHNVGELFPGDPTVFILVASSTRKKAFPVAREVLERVKREPPIFKLEVREDGEYWISGDGKRIPREKNNID